jgi:hypothetical protein
MARLSHLRGERDLQVQVLVMVGWMIVSLLVVAGFVLATMDASATDTTRDGDGGSVPLGVRIGLGVVFVLVAARLPVLVVRHRDQIATVAGLRRQYVTAGVVTLGLGVLGLLFWSWAAPVGGLLGLVALVMALRVRTVAPEEMTEQIDSADPEAWQDGSSRLLDAHPAVFWLLVVGLPILLVFGIAVVAFLLTGYAD